MSSAGSLLAQLAEDYGRRLWPNVDTTFETVSPATGEVLGHAPDCGQAEAALAADGITAAFDEWRRRTPFERSTVMNAWHQLVLANREGLAQLIAAEVGKPLRQARGEVDYANAFISWNAAECLRIEGEFLSNATPDRRQWVVSRPVGPSFGVTPWNFPAGMVTRSVAPALAAGCSMVLKPAEQSPLTALVLGSLWEEAGGPRDVFRVMPCADPRPASAVLMSDSRIRKLTFTGSHEIGMKLYRDCADTMKAISLELGGHAPFLVFEDADLDAAVQEAIDCKFRYGGQTCVCTNRIYVHESLASDFVSAYVQLASELTVGDPLDESTDIGPLIDAAGFAKVRRHVDDAMTKGAKAMIGGNALDGLYHEPTVMTAVEPDMAMMREETFGPVAPIATFRSEQEALRLANDTRFGLAAYFWTRDVGRTFRLVDELSAGIIGANDGVPGGVAHAPFGGVKESGVGRAGGRWGLEEFLEPKYVSLRLPAERGL